MDFLHYVAFEMLMTIWCARMVAKICGTPLISEILPERESSTLGVVRNLSTRPNHSLHPAFMLFLGRYIFRNAKKCYLARANKDYIILQNMTESICVFLTLFYLTFDQSTQGQPCSAACRGVVRYLTWTLQVPTLNPKASY